MIIRLRYTKQGGHYHCRLFTARRQGTTFAKCGDIVFDEFEWPEVLEKFLKIAEVLTNEPEHGYIFAQKCGYACLDPDDCDFPTCQCPPNAAREETNAAPHMGGYQPTTGNLDLSNPPGARADTPRADMIIQMLSDGREASAEHGIRLLERELALATWELNDRRGLDKAHAEERTRLATENTALRERTIEELAKIIDRKAGALRDEYCHGDTGPGGYIWTNKEAEWQVILLEELIEEFRALKKT